MTSPLEVYGEDLRSTMLDIGATSWLRYADDRTMVLDLPRWVAPATGADEVLLSRCTGPTLDIGCGPGRLTRGLLARGIECLGVDVAPVAVSLARLGGTPVLHASVFDVVLSDTRWASVLLADGNVGIGGDARALLARCRHLLVEGGAVLVELDAPDEPSRQELVRIESSSGQISSWFPWAQVSVADLDELAEGAVLDVADVWLASGRWFAELRRPG